MGALVAAHMPGVLDLVSSRSLGLRELMGAGAPLEKMVGKGPARPPIRSRFNQQETQVRLPSFYS